MKCEIKQIEISNFTLIYDGGFYLLKSEKVNSYVYLKPSQIIEMARIEGISIDKLENNFSDWEIVKFTKVTLIPSQTDINNKRELDYPKLWEHPRDSCEAFEMITVQIKK